MAWKTADIPEQRVRRVVKHSKSPEEAKLVADVKELAQRCEGGVHLYLKFIGD